MCCVSSSTTWKNNLYFRFSLLFDERLSISPKLIKKKLMLTKKTRRTRQTGCVQPIIVYIAYECSGSVSLLVPRPQTGQGHRVLSQAGPKLPQQPRATQHKTFAKNQVSCRCNFISQLGGPNAYSLPFIAANGANGATHPHNINDFSKSFAVTLICVLFLRVCTGVAPMMAKSLKAFKKQMGRR